jgi:hypothetical protein
MGKGTMNISATIRSACGDQGSDQKERRERQGTLDQGAVVRFSFIWIRTLVR